MEVNNAIKPIQLLLEQLNNKKELGECTGYWICAYYLAQALFKIIVLFMLAVSKDDAEKSKYELKIVQADGFGDWNSVLTSLTKQTGYNNFPQEIKSSELKEITEKVDKHCWQSQAVDSLINCVKTEGRKLKRHKNGNINFLEWFELFAEIRNIGAHTALTGHDPSDDMKSAELLVQSCCLILNNFSAFKKRWIYLNQDCSGKYRIVRLQPEKGISESCCNDLPKINNQQSMIGEGIYVVVKNNQYKINLLDTNSKLDDFFYPNGKFQKDSYETISYTRSLIIPKEYTRSIQNQNDFNANSPNHYDESNTLLVVNETSREDKNGGNLLADINKLTVSKYIENGITQNIPTEVKVTDFEKKMAVYIKNSKISELDKQNLFKNLLLVKERKINLLITGATGCGKSSTINALFNADVAKVGVGVNPETMEIQKYELDSLTLWDSPGLGDGKEADDRHAKNIVCKLNERDADGEPLIDLVLVVLDGSSRDLGTSYDLINHVIIPNLGENSHRILIAINQADMAMKGRYWNREENRPEPQLEQFLQQKVASVKARIQEGTGLDVDPIYYSAGYKDGVCDQDPYNLSKLLYYIISYTPKEKRAIYAGNINHDDKMWKNDDGLKDYRGGIFGSIVEFFSAIGETFGMVKDGFVDTAKSLWNVFFGW